MYIPDTQEEEDILKAYKADRDNLVTQVIIEARELAKLLEQLDYLDSSEQARRITKDEKIVG
tara:strand:- start:353 stop:538 length:186 start_codon:yes stop_codon:yes gene_type:complete